MAAALGCALALCATRPAFAKPSCGTEARTGERDEQIGGGTVKVSVPASYVASRATPLLVALHGDEGKPDYIYSVFRSLQKQHPGAFILVAPRATSGGRSWYKATQTHAAYVNAVVDDIIKRYNIDLDRVWITGWSGGATFLGTYALMRQDRFAAVVYHMGAQRSSVTPPAGSCKIPARYVIGSADFLYKLAKGGHDDLEARGHEVAWIELPGVGHKFQQSTLAPTWQWLQAHTLCGTTRPGSCGGGPAPKPDAGSAPAPRRDAGTAPRPDAGAGPVADAGWPPRADSSVAPDSAPAASPDAGPGSRGAPSHPRASGGGELYGGCSMAAAGEGEASKSGIAWLLLLLGATLLVARRCRVAGVEAVASFAPRRALRSASQEARLAERLATLLRQVPLVDVVVDAHGDELVVVVEAEQVDALECQRLAAAGLGAAAPLERDMGAVDDHRHRLEGGVGPLSPRPLGALGDAGDARSRSAGVLRLVVRAAFGEEGRERVGIAAVPGVVPIVGQAAERFITGHVYSPGCAAVRILRPDGLEGNRGGVVGAPWASATLVGLARLVDLARQQVGSYRADQRAVRPRRAGHRTR